MTVEENALQGAAEEANIAANQEQPEAVENQEDQSTENKVADSAPEQTVESIDNKTTITNAEAGKPAPKKQSWEQRRIDQLTGKFYQERREKEALQAIIDQSTNKNNVEDNNQSKTDVYKVAEQIASQRAFVEKCNNINDAGINKYTDFKDAVGTLAQVGLITNQGGQFLDMVVDMPNSHEVLYHLGKNPEEADRLVGLSPTKLAMELARIETKITSSPVLKQTTKAAAPIKALSGNNQATYTGDNIYDPNMTDDAYAAWRAKQPWASKN